jgi:NADH-quinone oxidoreductase subunit H
MFVASALMSALFFGGYNYPGMDIVAGLVPHNLATAIGIAVMFGKTTFFILFFMWVRWTIPRFRYDQLMALGWKSLIPLSLANIIITGVVLTAWPYITDWFRAVFS